MKKMDQIDNLFFTLLRQGLWGKTEAKPFTEISAPEWKKLLRLAQEQTVTGIVADGLEVNPEIKAPGDVAMKFVAAKIATEKRNHQINKQIEELIPQFDAADVPVIVVKGQTIAKCYREPLSRMPGDIDFVVRPENYERAKDLLKRLSGQEGEEVYNRLHFAAYMGDIDIEIHGTVHTCLSKRVNRCLDGMQEELFSNQNEEKTSSADFDVLFGFVHLLQHFYCGGIGLRQLCDLSMALHFHKGSYDKALLQNRLSTMRLSQEWSTFMAFLVNYIGLPEEDAFLYENKFDAKADKLWSFIKKSGNFGKNKKRKYDKKSNYLLGKTESFFRNGSIFFQHFSLFPLNTVKSFFYYTFTGLGAFARGE